MSLSRGKDTLASLAMKVGCSSAAMTGIRDKLFKSGFITELNEVGDRRCTPIVLTDEGNKMVESLKNYFSSNNLG